MKDGANIENRADFAETMDEISAGGGQLPPLAAGEAGAEQPQNEAGGQANQAQTAAENQTADSAAPAAAQEPLADPGVKPEAENKPEAEKQPAAEKQAGKSDPDNEPITDFSKVDLGLAPDAPVDQAIMDAFGHEAVKLGLTPRQAAGLAKFQMDIIESSRKQILDEGIAQLNREWGPNAKANQEAIMAMLSNVDRQAPGFLDALNASGATIHQDVVRGLLAISRALTEDSLGARHGLASAEAAEDPAKALAAMFKM